MPPRRGNKIVAPGEAALSGRYPGLRGLLVYSPPMRVARIGGGRGRVTQILGGAGYSIHHCLSLT